MLPSAGLPPSAMSYFKAAWLNFIHPVTGLFRKRRGVFMRAQFPDIESMHVCDLGGSIHFWQKVGIRLPPDQLTILNIDEYVAGAIPGQEVPYKVVVYDGKHIPFPDGQFDLLVCNSVIEHVPPGERAQLAREMTRVARRIFCQTPAYSFPVEPHFVMPALHWLPKSIAYWLVLVSPWRILARPNREQIHSYFYGTNLLRKRELQALFPEGRISEERFLGLAKSYYVVCTPR